MTLALGFAPFILFAILMRLSVDLALWVAFAAAFAIGIRAFLETQVLRLLDAGSMVLFAMLALYRGFVDPGLSATAVRVIIDSGLLAIVLGSLGLQQPFTIQYAREPRDDWDSPGFLRANYVLSMVWALALAITTAADAAIPMTGAVAAGLAALAGALAFTWRYPEFRPQSARRKR
jgi:hypothetical protein